jgi:hypothetical protein
LKQLTRPSCEITQRATVYGIGHYVVEKAQLGLSSSQLS